MRYILYHDILFVFHSCYVVSCVRVELRRCTCKLLHGVRVHILCCCFGQLFLDPFILNSLWLQLISWFSITQRILRYRDSRLSSCCMVLYLGDHRCCTLDHYHHLCLARISIACWNVVQDRHVCISSFLKIDASWLMIFVDVIVLIFCFMSSYLCYCVIVRDLLYRLRHIRSKSFGCLCYRT